MNVTTSNYAALAKNIDWSKVSPSLKKIHEELIPDASKNKWEAYNSDADIKRVVEKFFTNIAKHVNEDAAPTGAASSKKTRTPKQPTAAPKPRAAPKPKKATPQAEDLPQPRQVTYIDTATAFIKRYAAMHKKVRTRDQILSLVHGLQKAITEQRIKKNHPAIAEIDKMQSELLTLVNAMGESASIQIDDKALAHYKQIAQGEEVRTTVKLLKTFITMNGKPYDRNKAQALHVRMAKALEDVPNTDPYLKEIEAAMSALASYNKSTESTIYVPAATLHGLGSIAVGAGVDGLGAIHRHSGGPIVGKLVAEGVRNLSDTSLKRAFRHAAAPALCVQIAKQLMRSGRLTAAGLRDGVVKKKPVALAGVHGDESTVGSLPYLDRLDLRLRMAEGMGCASTGLGNPFAAVQGLPFTEGQAPALDAAKRSALPVSARELAQMRFKTIGYNGRFKNVFGDPEVGFHMMVYGPPFNGKSSFVIELCKELASLGRGKIGYLCLEEGISLSMQKKVLDRGADKVDGLKFYGVMPPSLAEFGFVVIDSVSDRRMSRDKLQQLFLTYPNVAFICIFHATKEGGARGGLDYEHDMDIVLKIENHTPAVQKNRFL